MLGEFLKSVLEERMKRSKMKSIITDAVIQAYMNDYMFFKLGGQSTLHVREELGDYVLGKIEEAGMLPPEYWIDDLYNVHNWEPEDENNG